MTLPSLKNMTRSQAAAFGFNARLNDLWLYLALPDDDITNLIRSAPIQAPRIDTGVNPEDFRNEIGLLYSLANFSGGEGLAFAHRRDLEPIDSTRFWNSDGIDVARPSPGELPAISLLPQTSAINTQAGSKQAMAYTGGALYHSGGQTLHRSTNPVATTPSFSTEDPFAAQGAVDIEDLVPLGQELYAALGTSGIHKRDGAGTWTHWSDLAAVRVWEAKGRIIASTGQSLYEAKSLATSVLLHTLPPVQKWTAVIDAGTHILASATDGTIYAFTLDESSGNIVLSTRTKLSSNERVTALHLARSSVLLFATAEYSTTHAKPIRSSVYTATISTNGNVTNATLVRRYEQLDGSTDVSINTFTDLDSDVYWCLAEGGGTYLWRYDLTSGARVRHMKISDSDLAIFNLLSLDKRLFVNAGTSVYRQSTTYISSGYLITPLIDHFSADIKTWAGVSVDVSPVTSGSVEVHYSTDPKAIHDPLHSSWTRAKLITNGTDTTETALVDINSRYLTLKIVLKPSSDSTSSPKLHSVFTRALPTSNDVIVTLPVNVSDQIESPNKRRIQIANYGVQLYDYLKTLQGRSVFLELIRPPETVRGVVVELVTLTRPNVTRGSSTFIMQVVVQGKRTGESGVGSYIGAFSTHHLFSHQPNFATVE